MLRRGCAGVREVYHAAADAGALELPAGNFVDIIVCDLRYPQFFHQPLPVGKFFFPALCVFF